MRENSKTNKIYIISLFQNTLSRAYLVCHAFQLVVSGPILNEDLTFPATWYLYMYKKKKAIIAPCIKLTKLWTKKVPESWANGIMIMWQTIVCSRLGHML